MENLYTVKHETEKTLEIKKSQFIAHLVPITDFESTLQHLHETHKKARHFVWASRLLNKHQQIVENCTDDGEPRNTSGKPTLKVLQGHEIINAAIITVRYFGGIKLGTGGLVRAYNDAAQLIISHAVLIPLNNLHKETIRVTYQQIHHVEYLLKKHTIKVHNKEFSAEYIDLVLQGEKSLITEIVAQLK